VPDEVLGQRWLAYLGLGSGLIALMLGTEVLVRQRLQFVGQPKTRCSSSRRSFGGHPARVLIVAVKMGSAERHI
jgi:hypothetical protein